VRGRRGGALGGHDVVSILGFRPVKGGEAR
jgi:hypothetical protein